MKIAATLLAVLAFAFLATANASSVVSELDARIVSVEPVGKDFPGTIVTIEVKNGGATWIEPLDFTLTLRDRAEEPVIAARVLAPRFGRAGHVVAPKKKERYFVQLRQSVKELAGAKIAIGAQSEYAEAPPLYEVADVVKMTRFSVDRQFDALRNQTLPRTTVPLENRLATPVEVTLRVEFKGRSDGTALVTTRLEPNESRDIVIAEIAYPMDAVGATTGPEGVDARSVEIVDFSVVIDDGQGVARRELEAAWNSWARIAPEHFPLRVPFRSRSVLRGLFGSTPDERFDLEETLIGVLVLMADGTFTLEAPNGEALKGRSLRSVRDVMEDAVVHIARPTFEALVEGSNLRLLESGEQTVVAVEKKEPLFDTPLAAVTIAVGRIVQTGWLDAPTQAATNWRALAQQAGAPWRIAEKITDDTRAGATRLALRYTPYMDGAVLARVEYHKDGRQLTMPEDVAIAFDEWIAGAAPATVQPPPTGPLAERVRAAWDRFYRYPEPGALVSGSYAIVTPGTDGVWIGRKRVEGTFELGDIDGGFWRHCVTTVAEKRISPTENDTLINAVEDRFLMWSGPDLCRRPRFDEAFAGATLSEGDDGWILAEDCSIGGLLLTGPRIDALKDRSGRSQRVTWTEIDGVVLPKDYSSGDWALRIEWARVADGWYFPSRTEFIGNFGPDWGPETLTMKVLKVVL